jgi:hypothetical protein
MRAITILAAAVAITASSLGGQRRQSGIQPTGMSRSSTLSNELRLVEVNRSSEGVGVVIRRPESAVGHPLDLNESQHELALRLCFFRAMVSRRRPTSRLGYRGNRLSLKGFNAVTSSLVGMVVGRDDGRPNDDEVLVARFVSHFLDTESRIGSVGGRVGCSAEDFVGSRAKIELGRANTGERIVTESVLYFQSVISTRRTRRRAQWFCPV